MQNLDATSTASPQRAMAGPENLEDCSGTANQEMTRLAIVLRLCVCFVIALLLLRWIYPWQIHYGSFNVTWVQAWKPYIAVAAAMTATGALAAYAGSHFVRAARPLASIST